MDRKVSRHVRRVCVVLLSLFVLAAAACDQPSQSNALPDAQQIVRVASWGAGDDIQALDPARERTGNEYFPFAEQVITLLYTRLTDLDAQQHPVLSAAGAVKVSTDGLTYTFTLRPHLRFGDGATIASADVAYSLNRALSPCALPPPQSGTISNMRGASSLAWALLAIKDSATFNAERCDPDGTIRPSSVQHMPLVTTLIGDSIRTPDPATLVLTLDHPDSAFLLNLARPVASIVDQRLLQRYGDDWIAHLAGSSGQGTSGMYTLEFADIDIVAGHAVNSYIATQGLRLTRSHTWTLTQPRLRQITITFPRVDDLRDSYLAGQADLLPDLRTVHLDQARHDPGYHEAPMPSLDYLALDWNFPPFDDLRVRQAFALALDKTQIAPLALWSATQPTNHLIPEGVTGYNAGLTAPLGVTALTGDTAKARALWLSYVADTCSGNAGKCPAVQLFGASCHTPAIRDNMAQLMLTSWRQAMPGLRVSFTGNSYPSCVLFANQTSTRPCQLVRFSWDADMFEPRAWLTPLFDPSDPQYVFADPSGHASYCTQDTQAIALLHAAGSATDAATRTRLYQRAEQQLVKDVAMIPLYQYRASWEVRPNVSHYPVTYRPWIGQSEWAAIYLAKP